LSFIDLAAQPAKQFGLGNQELNLRYGSALRRQGNVGKPCEPSCDIILIIGSLEAS
jgi:hypothetical protein